MRLKRFWFYSAMVSSASLFAEIDPLLLPASFASLSIAHENNYLYVKNSIFNHLDESYHTCLLDWRSCSLWVAPFVAGTNQNREKHVLPFWDTSEGFVLGMETSPFSAQTYGIAFGYAHTDFRWKERRGRVHLNSFYLSLYKRRELCCGYIEGSLIGGYNLSSIRRKMDLEKFDFHSHARSSHNGWDIGGNVKAGLYCYEPCSFLLVSPYIDVDAVYVHENRFREDGAEEFDLMIDERNFTLVSTEVGLDFSTCVITCSCGPITPFLLASFIRESRFENKNVKGKIFDSQFQIRAEAPSRSLGSIVLGFNAPYGNVGPISIFYRGKYNQKYQDHSLNIDLTF